VNRGLKINFQRGKENPRHGFKKAIGGGVSGPLLQWAGNQHDKRKIDGNGPD